MSPFLNRFATLYTTQELSSLHHEFCCFLKTKDEILSTSYENAKNDSSLLSSQEESELLVKVAPFIEDFLSTFFGIEKEINTIRQRHHQLKIIYFAKRQFIQRYALKRYFINTLTNADFLKAKAFLKNKGLDLANDLSLASAFSLWIQKSETHQEELKQASIFSVFAVHDSLIKRDYQHSTLFQQPAPLAFDNFLSDYKNNEGYCAQSPKHSRDGFELTDHGASLAYAMDQAQYCIGCAKQGRDSCSLGLKDREGQFQKNPLETPLLGCPLEQKISEMNDLKAKGYTIAALAIAMVDNPMIPLSGHRICNDCSKACIYQKQDPVNIPSIETQNLKDVLDLPFGVEIYTLLTFWNPLNLRRPYKNNFTGNRVLVVGAGPAGITLSHHLLMEGHEVLLIEGAKIEPLPEDISKPVKSWETFEESLETRTPSGFGGVADYGITVRWNKNFLKLVRLTLERHASFQLMGGIRFGGNITIQDAFEDLEIDHIALCMGSGKPTLLEIPGNLTRGVIQASDFLMSLQLMGAFQKNTWTNLQIRLPIVVIGGGLTAIDTATEALAYYPRYVENTVSSFNSLSHDAKIKFLSSLTHTEKEIFDEMQSHYQLFQSERNQAKLYNRPLNFLSILKKLGGVKVLYRKDFTEAPSYKLNHEEVKHALEEGIEIIENSVPLSIQLDHNHSVIGIKVQKNRQETAVNAKTIIVAMGTKPNTNIVLDEPLFFQQEGHALAPIEPLTKQPIILQETNHKTKQPSFLCYLDDQFKGISFYGDMHPSFAGSVVKAMASAKKGYPLITELLGKREKSEKHATIIDLKEKLTSKIVAVNALTPTISEIIIDSKMASKNFKPGQFFRVQNYRNSKAIPMEPLALTGAKVDTEKGHLSLIVLNQGASSYVCSHMQPDENIMVMGPTGTPTQIPSHKKVLLIGGGVGNAVLFSIGKAMREKGCRVIYFAGYKKEDDIFEKDLIEEACESVVWCCDEKKITPRRECDHAFHGNMIDALKAYSKSELKIRIPLNNIEHTLIIGSHILMSHIQYFFKNEMSAALKNNENIIASINSPMQCMMKGVCAKCLQKHENSTTNEVYYLYSCADQDQSLMTIDFKNLDDRLSQNSFLEKMRKNLILQNSQSNDI